MTRTVFRGGSVFDGTGADPAPADVVVEDGRIVDVGLGLDGDDAVDLDGRTLLPGLFDCHVHVSTSHVDAWRLANTPFSYRFYEAEKNLGLTLRAGITSVRDASGADLGMQQALLDGLIVGPRMQISIAMVSQTGGHADDWLASGVNVPLTAPYPGLPSGIVDGPDEMRRKVRELHRNGANVIKVATSGGVLSARDNPAHAHFSPEELDVLVAEATAAGMFVMAHAQGADGIKNAVRAGIRSIEHGIFLDAEAIDLMLARGTWLVPTLVAPQGVIDAAASGVTFPPGVAREGDVPPRPPSAQRGHGVRRRRAHRDGHRRGRRAARQKPARAQADARPRHGARRRPRGDDPERRPAAGRGRPSSGRSRRASSRTSWWSGAIPMTSRPCPTGSTASGSAAGRSDPRPPSTFGP